jgi:2-oxoglutarate dehydrogenase E1 component
MALRERLIGANLAYALELYDRYRTDPGAVDPALAAELAALAAAAPQAASAPAAATGGIDVGHVVGAARLARNIREYGHLAASLDPLGSPPPGDPALLPQAHGIDDAILASLPAAVVRPRVPAGAASCLDAIDRLRQIYCGPLGYDFGHVHDFAEREWLRETVESGTFAAPLEAAQRRALLARLTEVEAFERHLHQVYRGQKRFSVEGADMLVPMLDALVADAVGAGCRQVVIGMAHRGRLNVLAHLFGKPYAAIFAEFHAGPDIPDHDVDASQGWTGDVKYHLGSRRTLYDGDLMEVQLTLANNPSHLEFVNPVVQGLTRAAQDRRDRPGAPAQDADRALAITVHGDASFPGEGVVAETLNLCRLAGYGAGGVVHLIVNNQLGFTTEPAEGRSTRFASDLAKGFEMPIIHVNADRPEACLAAVRIAAAYRRTFHKDFLVDLVGYRRWGHNEGDEPSFTQPVMYAAIAAHPTVRSLYAAELAAAGVVPAEEADGLLAAAMRRLSEAQEAPRSMPAATGDGAPARMAAAPAAPAPVDEGSLRDINRALLERPAGFTVNPKLERLLSRRREAIDQSGGIDWAHAEALAFATILRGGTPIRLSGQDTERGTFSQRHLVLHDAATGARYVPLQALPGATATFAVYNSPLSEAAVLGFEYGYALAAPETLVLWEAQFGDFANAAQVAIDQFLVSARAKWRDTCGLVLLLPHGSEGQGPEHSSARPERFLQLAAEDNLRLANCTTAAQYFHLLREQAAQLGPGARPLVVFTPKSLLRHPLAASSLADLVHGRFEPVLEDAAALQRHAEVERVVCASGKVGIDLLAAAAKRSEAYRRVALIRLEQLYPLPVDELRQALGHYPNMRQAVWLQEEPRNMGAYRHIAHRLEALLPVGVTLEYVGLPERAAPAEGLAGLFAEQHARILDEALAGARGEALKGRGVRSHGH